MIKDTLILNSSKNKFLVFQLQDSLYGIKIHYLTEIIQLPFITEIPNMKNYVRGVADLRGKVIPVFDTKLLLGFAESEDMEKSCLMVLNIKGKQAGFIADSVREALSIPEENIDSLLNIKETLHSHFIEAAGRLKNDQAVILLNTEALIEGEHSLQ